MRVEIVYWFNGCSCDGDTGERVHARFSDSSIRWGRKQQPGGILGGVIRQPRS